MYMQCTILYTCRNLLGLTFEYMCKIVRQIVYFFVQNNKNKIRLKSCIYDFKVIFNLIKFNYYSISIIQ